MNGCVFAAGAGSLRSPGSTPGASLDSQMALGLGQRREDRQEGGAAGGFVGLGAPGEHERGQGVGVVEHDGA